MRKQLTTSGMMEMFLAKIANDVSCDGVAFAKMAKHVSYDGAVFVKIAHGSYWFASFCIPFT